MADVNLTLPEGALLNASVTVAGYLDADGEMKYVVATHGDVPLSTSLGLLELAKHDLLRPDDDD